eukprot:366278-Chlamydomonas_euryale.AAC.54
MDTAVASATAPVLPACARSSIAAQGPAMASGIVAARMASTLTQRSSSIAGRRASVKKSQ